MFDPIIVGPAKLSPAGGAGWAVLAVAALITSAAALAGSRVVVDSSFRRQFFRGSVVRRDDRALNAAFGGTSTLVLLIEGDREGAIEDPRVLEGIDSLERWFESQAAGSARRSRSSTS